MMGSLSERRLWAWVAVAAAAISIALTATTGALVVFGAFPSSP